MGINLFKHFFDKSLLYAIYIQSGEPWVYGGEYLALSQHAENVISAWLQVGFRPTVVFDGMVGLSSGFGKCPLLLSFALL